MNEYGMEPLVSIGMAVFNCEKTLRAALRSILNQTYQNWELLLIDDGSTDQTLAIARSFSDPRITVIADSFHKQLPDRLNLAVALSRGQYFARMDGDDIAYPERLQAQVDYLEQHPEIDLVGSGTLTFGQGGQPLGIHCSVTSHAQICRRPRAGIYLAHPTWMGRIEWFQTYPYRSDAIRVEDQELLLRTYQTSRFASLPTVLLGYRIEALSLKKILTGRYHFALALLEKAWAERNYAFALGAIEQAAKAAVDLVAIATRSETKLLQHRFGQSVDLDHQQQWQQIWADCHRERSYVSGVES